MTTAPAPARTIYSAVAVANWFIERNRIEPCELTHLKLQKLLYFAQGWYLAYHNAPLFEDPIEAWKYGPVVRSVYYALNDRRKNEVITEPIEGYVLQGENYKVIGTPGMSFRDDGTEVFMVSIWKNYSRMNPWELVSISHAKESPWDRVSKSLEVSYDDAGVGWGIGFSSTVIPVELMKSYFKSLLSEAS
ncbi:MAG: DUF4065 domain-containing protein [Deltaproteobacteria bacterium]|jgi:uncharacterized phage-associated protein|nr:DUF4065 domain-containing protein [Deltaproteobacteria bacterium]